MPSLIESGHGKCKGERGFKNFARILYTRTLPVLKSRSATETGWSDVIDLGRNTTAQELNVLTDQLCLAAVLWSDGGPLFTSSKFANFLITHPRAHLTKCRHDKAMEKRKLLSSQ